MPAWDTQLGFMGTGSYTEPYFSQSPRRERAKTAHVCHWAGPVPAPSDQRQTNTCSWTRDFIYSLSHVHTHAHTHTQNMDSTRCIAHILSTHTLLFSTCTKSYSLSHTRLCLSFRYVYIPLWLSKPIGIVAQTFIPFHNVCATQQNILMSTSEQQLQHWTLNSRGRP